MNGARQQQGFVLVSSIWLTLIMFVLAGLFSVYASRQLDHAVLSKERVKLELDQIATENTLLYLFSIGASRRSGLSIVGLDDADIRLDSQVYQGLGDALFQVQEYAGLIGLNTTSNYHLNNLLESFESSGLRRRALTEALYDYIDIDERPRLNGREAPAYRVAKLIPPTNDYLKSPVELTRVFGWQAWMTDQPEFNLDDWFSTNWRSRVNLNTMPENLLARFLPISDKDRQRLIEHRRREPFVNMTEVDAILNIRSTLDEDYYTFLPANTYRFRIFSAKNRKLSTMTVRFSPLSTRTSWEVEYRYESERNFDIAEPVGIVHAGYFGWQLPAAEG